MGRNNTHRYFGDEPKNRICKPVYTHENNATTLRKAVLQLKKRHNDFTEHHAFRALSLTRAYLELLSFLPRSVERF